jgi:hypothetical protein
MHLQHVALKDFVPETYAFPSNCKVHAHRTRCHSMDDFRVWIQNPLWTDRRLASFNVQPLLTSLENGTIYAVRCEPSVLPVMQSKSDAVHQNISAKRCMQPMVSEQGACAHACNLQRRRSFAHSPSQKL